jgi:hypothetical protein
MNLLRLGLRKSSPLRAGHPAIGQPCVLCERAIRAGDETGRVPEPDSEELVITDGLVCHWTCIENGLYRLRQRGETTPGTTRRFLESWADAFNRQALAGGQFATYTSEADFILKNGRPYEAAALPRGIRMGRPRECFRNAATLALRKPNLYTYVEGYAVNRWIAMHTVAHAWCVGSDNYAVDPTWDEGTEYFGVAFRHDYLRRVLKSRRDYGLIDNPEMDFPLVTGAHRADEAVVTLCQESA